MKKLLFTLLVLFTGILAYAQTTIQGTVIDEESNEPLIGASVLLTGTTTGTITDIDGNFTLETDQPSGTIEISYTGYKSIFKVINSSGVINLGRVELEESVVGLQEVEVIASVAVDRKTPVAVSTIKGTQIEALVGNQEFPEILRKTPSVYVTKEGGGFGDSRINVRGFDQRNTAVMINGIPVNDMENGWVYWSNWAGLSDVTSTMQVQRGLGASKLAVPSVGGSINIITNAAEMRKGGAVSVSLGNDGYQKYGVVLSTGLGDKGWALTVQGTHTRGDGYIDHTKFRAYSYFASVSKVFNEKHTINATALGAPQWHHQRLTASPFDAVTLRTFHDPDNEGSDFGRGIRFNHYGGTLDGEEFNWRRNFFHKPHMNINHYWNINGKTNLKTSVYASYGRGGGTGPRGRLRTPGSVFDSFGGFGSGTHDANGNVRFDDIARYNQGQQVSSWGDAKEQENGQFLVTSDGRFYFDDGSRNNNGSGFIRRASMNYHNWYGIISNLDTKLAENLTLVAGIDGRYYKGEHFRRLDHLLGADGYVSRSDDNRPSNLITEPVSSTFGNYYDDGYKNGNNVLNYHNDGLVRWFGLYGQLEYSTDRLTTFVSLSGSTQGFKRVDYFNYLDSDPAQTSDWESHLGGTIKAGVNYNLDDRNNIFANAGYFSRQPIFDNVFLNFVNDVNPDVKNQKVIAVEAGYGYRSSFLSGNINLYATNWSNRQSDFSVRDANGDDILYALSNIGQLHTGLELDFILKPTRALNINGMLSVGNWKYSDDFNAKVTNTDTNEKLPDATIFADGLKVGDAAQTTFSIGANYEIAKGFRIYGDYYFADNLYANYDVNDGQFLSRGGEVAKLPSYSLVDLGLSYNIDISGMDMTFRFNMNNVLDKTYISEMDTNIQDDPATSRNELYDNRGLFGFGRTWNTGIKVRF